MIDFHSQLSIIPQVYNSAELQDNLEHSGGITISWNSATDAEIPLGSYVTYRGIRYILLEKYAPAKSGSTHYRYEPTFRHPQNMLDRIPFWVKSRDAEGNPVNLQTTSFTGYPHTIVQKVVDFINTEYYDETGDTFFRQTVGTGWKFSIPRTVIDGIVQPSNVIITVGFDGCSIKSAANAIADAMGCNVFFDWSAKTIRFVVGTTIQGETYNCFHVLGGTTNMGKTTTSGGYAVVTQRMTLREPNGGGTSEDITINGKTFQLLKGSIISGAGDGIRLITDLIFDNIYPKQVLYIKSARQRLCYLTDENGERIVDDAQAGTFKTFAKWYLTFATSKNDSAASTWPSYVFDQSLLIQDMPLGLLFQIDYDNPQDMSSLVGQEFEMTYYPTQQHEKDKIDVDSQGFTVEAGEFYVAVKAQGNIILPCTAGTISKGTVDYAYSSVGVFPPASANVVGKLAIANGVNRIYECQAVSAGAYDWVPKSDLIGTDEGYVVRHGNLNGSFMSTDVLANHLIVWNATSDEWTDGGVYSGLFPNVGDKVTLLNMALSDTQKSNAKQELLDAAKEIIGAMITPSGEYQEQVIFADEVGGVQPDNTIPFKEIGSASPFGEGHGPIVTNINQNLDTNVAEVTVGSWARKTKTGGTVDKIDTVNISTGSSTTGGSSYGDGTIGDGGGYTPGGNSSNEQQTINQTVPKADTLFVAQLSTPITSINCDANGIIISDAQGVDIYTKVGAYYGTRTVTDICNITLMSVLTQHSITVTREKDLGDKTLHKEMTANIAENLSDDKYWLRIHFPQNTDFKNFDDSLKITFVVNHQYHGDRDLIFEIDANREGVQGKYEVSEYGRYNSSAADAYGVPTGNRDTTGITTVSPIDLQVGWVASAPATTSTYRYIWKRTCIYNPNTNTYETDSSGNYVFSYVCLTGVKGLQGCVIRTSEWKIGQEYRNDENDETVEVGYIDVVGVASNNPNNNEGYDFFRCKQTHTSSSLVDTSDSDYWEKLTDVGPIYTSFLVAKNAYIKFGTGNQFVITNEYNVIKAGMKGGGTESQDHGGIRIWAGSNPTGGGAQDPTDIPIANSPFLVYNDGSVVMTKAEMTGSFSSFDELIKTRAFNPYYEGDEKKYMQCQLVLKDEKDDTEITLATGLKDHFETIISCMREGKTYGINGATGFFCRLPHSSGSGYTTFDGLSGTLVVAGVGGSTITLTVKGGIIVGASGGFTPDSSSSSSSS